MADSSTPDLSPRGEPRWWGLETSSSSGNAESGEVKERSLGKQGNENGKASQSRDRPAGSGGANVLTSDMYQQHPDAPPPRQSLLRIYAFPHHKRQILGERSRNGVDIWSGTQGLLPQIFWNSRHSKWKGRNEYKAVQNSNQLRVEMVLIQHQLDPNVGSGSSPFPGIRWILITTVSLLIFMIICSVPRSLFAFSYWLLTE